jgi:two-component system, OmpR family, osmolarity sensor histidine kinase EnvZ
MKDMRFISNFLPKTLFARFMLIIILPPLIGQLALVFLFYDRHWYNVSYYTSNVIANEISHLFEMLSTDKERLLASEGEYLNLTYKFYPHDSLPTKQKKISEELQIFKNILNTKISKTNIIRLAYKNKIDIFFPFERGVIKVTISARLLLNPTTYIFILWLIFLTLILLSISVIFSQRQIRPILQLAEAADSFGKGNKNFAGYKPRGASEIRKAGLAFIKMKDRIERQVSARTQMLAMISHDLRTPLTRMRLQTELIDDNALKEEFMDEINAMNQMITSYLEFAKGEKGEEFQDIDINKWFKDFIKDKCGKYNVSFEESSDNLFVRIKPRFFERAISNLIDNAAKYSTMAKISATCEESKIIINIEDNGIGIKDEEKKLVFKPFYRSDKSRNVDLGPSVGLGLAITKEIIADLGGNITLADGKALKGLRVTIILPKATS